MQKNILLEYLNCRRAPLAHHEGAVALHRALCESAPEFYMSLLADPSTDPSHRREIFVNVLGHAAAQGIERQQILAVLQLLSADEALQVLGVVHDLRINRSRARELVLAFVLGHEQFASLAAIKRQRLARLLKHVLGERTWSAIKRALASVTPEGEALLQREVLHYAWNGDVARAREVLCFLAGVPFSPTHPDLAKSVAARQQLEQGLGLPEQTLLGIRGIFQKQIPPGRIRQLAAKASEAAHVDGPLTKLYKEDFLTRPAVTNLMAETKPDGPLVAAYKVVKELFERPVSNEGIACFGLDVAEQVDQAVEALPLVEGRISVVLDLSASMVSSGERLYHPIALALALTCLLQTRVRDVQLSVVPERSERGLDVLPQPQGAADLAMAMIEAARQQPQALLVISDGYENVRQGDVVQVVRGLRQLGLNFPIYQVVPVFVASEKLAQRRLAEIMPVLPIAHEDGVSELLAHVLLAAAEERVTAGEMEQLQHLLTVR